MEVRIFAGAPAPFRFITSARANIWAAGFNVATNFLVVPEYGYWGAAWATLVAYGLSLFLMTRGNHRLLPEIAWPGITGRLTTVAFVSSGIALLLRPLATGVITALGAGVLSVISVMVLALMQGLITRGDLGRLNPSRRPEPSPRPPAPPAAPPA